ncbi:MAG: hypothetical protein LBN34_07105 [Clostridiales Family XIII bacterium]|jgi:hypothetical protein|nr:hypothetical protein [Clostridiales Family XIII bacterium]
MKAVLEQAKIISIILKIIAALSIIWGLFTFFEMGELGVFGILLGVISAAFCVGFAVVIDLLATIASNSGKNFDSTTISNDDLPSL